MIDRNSFVPIYHQVAGILKEQMRSGQIKPGDKLPSEAEMIAHYKIGRLTVREALNQLLKDDCIEKIQGKGTYCKGAPRKSAGINVDVLLDMSDTYFIPYYIQSISDVLVANNANFIISDTKASDKEICILIDKIIAKGSSGIILQPSHGLECKYDMIHDSFQKLMDAGIPYIMIDGIYEDINASYLILDDKLGGAMAYDYLNNLGHRHVALVYAAGYKDSMLRLNGFLEKMKSAEDKEKMQVTLLERETQLETKIEEMMTGEQVPTAIFCYNDETAVRCLKQLKGMGIKVPEQISLLGFDDSLVALNVEPALTTIAHPKGLIGEKAVHALFDIINKKAIWPYRKVFKPVFVERGSCRKVQ